MSLALAVTTAVLLALLFPPYGFPMLAPVALAPILYAVKREALWQRRMAIGEAAGIAYWLLHCYWVNYVLATHGVAEAIRRLNLYAE